jgi:hypothetical protein
MRWRLEAWRGLEFVGGNNLIEFQVRIAMSIEIARQKVSLMGSLRWEVCGFRAQNRPTGLSLSLRAQGARSVKKILRCINSA